MLTDPFYQPGAKYSESSTGVIDLNMATSYVEGGLALVGALESAGWTIVDSGVSVATQTRPAFYLQTVTDPGPGAPPPREMTLEECNSQAGASWRRAGVGGTIYNSYNPFLLTPTCASGTGGIAWFAAGETTLDTATNLADKISGSGIFIAAVTGTVGDPAAGGSYVLTLTSLAPAFENDEIEISIGGGDLTSRRGFYTLRSPSLDGVYLECKIETRVTNNSGGFFAYDGVGTIKLCLEITASGGGTYYMPFMPGNYNFCGCHHQFLMWPVAGAGSRNANSSILVSLIEPPDEHLIGGVCPLVIGSNNGDLNSNFDHLRNQLHWSMSLASGHSGAMDDTAYRKGDSDGYQKVSMLIRGTKGRPTVSLAGQPLVQAPYVVLPGNPTTGDEAQIVGKLWDIVLTSGGATPGAAMLHDGKRWTCFSTTLPLGDVGCDMWILSNAG